MPLKLWIYSNPRIHPLKKSNSLGISRPCFQGLNSRPVIRILPIKSNNTNELQKEKIPIDSKINSWKLPFFRAVAGI